MRPRLHPQTLRKAQRDAATRARVHHIPVAGVVAEWDPEAVGIGEEGPVRGLWRLVVVSCPFCGGDHTHGGGADPDPASLFPLGSRVSHCEDLELAGSYDLSPVNPFIEKE